jgi:hypothetical protein
MISLLAAMHALAAQRGEGLHPQLVNLLESSKPTLKADRAEPGSKVAAPELNPHENFFRFPTKAKADGDSR